MIRGGNLLAIAFSLLLAASVADASGMSSPSKTRMLLHESESRRPAMQRSISGLPEKEVAPLTPQAYNEFLRAASDIKVLQVQYRLLIQVRRVPFECSGSRPEIAPARSVDLLVTGKEPTLRHTATSVVNHHHLRKPHGAEPHVLYQEANELKRDNLELRRKLREGDLQQKTSNLELMEQNMKLRDENYEMKKVDVDACDLHLVPSNLHSERRTVSSGGIPGVESMAPDSYSL